MKEDSEMKLVEIVKEKLESETIENTGKVEKILSS